MDRDAIRAKFGADYAANDLTFQMGIDVRFANISQIASRTKLCWKPAQAVDSLPSHSPERRLMSFQWKLMQKG